MTAGGVVERRAIAAETFVEAATHVCCAALGLAAHAGVMLHRASGPTGLAVDNYPDTSDELRRFAVTEDAWKMNPVMVELRRQLAILGPGFTNVRRFNALARERGYQGIDRHPFAVPLLGSDGWFGTIVYMLSAAPSAALERQLTMLAAELSVWCTARGISTLPEVRPLAPRQHEVAALAANGRTNPEIAETLGISINTVKLRLKQAFTRFGVESRTELANLLRRLAPLDGIPPGVTHRDAVTITRDTMPSPAASVASLGVAH
jgi:DNA-binding CsgD family transcriptional regulator